MDLSPLHASNKNKTTEAITGVLAPYGYSTGAGGYDAEDRLVAWNRADNNDNESWTLTSAGDWSQFSNASGTETRTHSPVHELTGINGAALSYDPKGNLVSSASDGASYVWDFDNRLSSATTGGAAATFAYDALGRRVLKASGGSTTVYICGDEVGSRLPLWREISEYALGSAPGTPLRTYVFGAGVDEPLLFNVGVAQYYYYANSLGSVIFLGDSNGTLAECYAYSAYGTAQILRPDGTRLGSGSNVRNSLLYTARRFDSETGLYFYRARYYSGPLGRFLSRDPVGDGRLCVGSNDASPKCSSNCCDNLARPPFAYDLSAERIGAPTRFPVNRNWYRYARSNPIRVIDPTGLVAITVVSPEDECQTQLDACEEAAEELFQQCISEDYEKTWAECEEELDDDLDSCLDAFNECMDNIKRKKRKRTNWWKYCIFYFAL